MKLIKARVQNYRSIEDSGWVDIEGDITALVGKNESGKTAFMQALFKLHPVEPATYDEVVDFPSRLTRKRKDTTGPIPVATVQYELSDDEVGEIEENLGTGVLKSRLVQVEGGYRFKARTMNVELDESVAVAHLRADLDLAAAAGKAVNSATTIAGLAAALADLEEPPAKAEALATAIGNWRENRLVLHVIDAYVKKWEPTFVYFDDYSTMPGKVSIPRLIEKRDSGTLVRGLRALLSFLKLGSGTPEDFNDSANHERLIRELENTANGISDEVFHYWSQNEELSVELKVMEPEAGAEPPLDQGPIFHVRVHNRRHRVSVPFDERSRGFVWFFSFVAYFSELDAAKTSDLIVLLDEPGLALHATAQGDLLRYMEERLAPEHQVIYTTHSPFMIDATHIERARTVMDVDNEGTKVSSEVFRVDDETVFPLQAALGYTLTQTLFIGPKNLLLEGPSDLIYLDILDDDLRQHDLTPIDDDVTRVPVGGAGKLSTFVSLIGSNQLNMAVLVDSSTKDAEAVERLQQAQKLKKGALIHMSDITGEPECDIEDLFDPAFYLDLVNRAYAKELDGSPLTLADLPKKAGRITKKINGALARRKIAGGVLNHYRPAVVLLRNQADLVPTIDDATRERFSNLAERVNRIL
ncbi:AAA family ATPase [Rhabdothermincola sp.]|uniref:AAA family ATPase n=1 Tax=Rhabdothermincola sp. TaxID=2820405 RepID=UPI002FE02108